MTVTTLGRVNVTTPGTPVPLSTDPNQRVAKIFAQVIPGLTGKGYLGTELIRDEEVPLRFVTLDFWKSQAAYELFKKKHRAEYRQIDKKCESLTEGEKPIGYFRRVGIRGLGAPRRTV